jgi:4-amino-4-deoxy-L-arabinose transferase-like glycosyltransferase
LGGAVFLIANPVFIYTSGLAWNHDFPVLLNALALVVYCRALQREDRGKWVAIAGALLGMAVGARLIFVLLLIPFLMMALFYPGLGAWKRRLHSVTALLLGTFAALSPALLTFALSGERFVWGNLGYHQLNELYRQQTGHTQMMTPESKLDYLRDVLTEPGTLILLLLAAILLLTNLRRMRMEPARYIGFALASLLIPFALVGALIPTPTWYQYYYAPVSLLVLGVIYGLVPHSGRTKLDWRLGLFLVAVIASGVAGLSGYLRAGLLSTENWVPIKTHRTGEEIKVRVPDGKVLTLAPIFPLEGGVGIYKELAAGPFTWRSATLMPAGERAQLGIISEQELGELLASDPPAGILVGYEPDLEGPLARYAQDGNFVPFDLMDGKTLWVARR